MRKIVNGSGKLGGGASGLEGVICYNCMQVFISLSDGGGDGACKKIDQSNHSCSNREGGSNSLMNEMWNQELSATMSSTNNSKEIYAINKF